MLSASKKCMNACLSSRTGAHRAIQHWENLQFEKMIMQIENMRSQLQLIYVTIFPFAFSCAVVHFEWESVSVQSPHCANYFTINCRFFILIETGIGKPLYSASRTWHLNWWKMIGRKSTFHSVSQTQCDLLYLLWASDVRTYNDFKRRVWKAEGERDTKHTHKLVH